MQDAVILSIYMHRFKVYVGHLLRLLLLETYRAHVYRQMAVSQLLIRVQWEVRTAITVSAQVLTVCG